MRVLVTGATGFVGLPLMRVLTEAGHEARGVARRLVTPNGTAGRISIGPDLGPDAEWREHVQGVDAVVHLAARVHVMRETLADPLLEFRRINCAGTERLARQAAQAGVRRFVYLSTIKVNGECTFDAAFRESDPAQPEDAYAISKWEAEQALWSVSNETGLEVVIVRPPLVYGPEVKGNFFSLLRLVRASIPLPLASVNNRRSFVSVDNLVDLIVTCLCHSQAPGQVFLAADGEDLSTPELIRRIARSMGSVDRLFRFPPWLLKTASAAVRRGAACERLCGSLIVDASKARHVLGWQPISSVDEAMNKMTRWFVESQRQRSQPRYASAGKK